MDKNRILAYIEQQEKNISFIKERLEIQSDASYNRIKNGVSERQYNLVEIEIIQDKINLAKEKLRTLPTS